MQLPSGYMDFRIRPLEAGDAERLSRFYHALSESTRFFFEPYRDTSVEGMRAVVKRALDGTDLSLVALDAAGEVFAHIFYTNVAHDVPHLGIGLRDEYHGRGLGTALLAYLIALGKHALNKRKVGLTLIKENARAFHLYSKFGFELVRENVSCRDENDSYEMHLTLG